MNESRATSSFYAFAELYHRLNLGIDEASLLNAIEEVLSRANDKEKQIIIRLLSGWRPKKNISQEQLKEWLVEHINLPLWLLRASYEVSGDWVETLSLSLPNETTDAAPRGITLWIDEIENFSQLNETDQKSWLYNALNTVSNKERIIINRLLTGTLNKRVHRAILTKAISKFLGKSLHHVAHRIIDKDQLLSRSFQEAFETPHPFDELSEPLAFHTMIERNVISSEDDLLHTIYEINHEGIRAQMIRRKGHTFLWNEQSELISDRFPEFERIPSTDRLDFVLDGVIMFITDDRSRAAELLEKRVTNKIIARKREKVPVVFVAQDILEKEGLSTRDRPLMERKTMVSTLVSGLGHEGLLVSNFDNVTSLEELLRIQAEVHPRGLVIKKLQSYYGPLSVPWTLIPPKRYSIKALLLYVSRSGGWAFSGMNELTFGVWKNDEIVPITKVKCELKAQEQKALLKFIKENTIDRFGPVRSVVASQVFLLSFEAVYAAKRRKSGLTLREVRVEEWCKGEEPQMAGQIAQLREWL